MEQSIEKTYSYKDAPTLWAFTQDDTFCRAVKGPVGSGKSSAMVIEILERAKKQAPGPDGVRRTRWAVVRNTYPQLIDTTIKTFFDWAPPEYLGHYRENPRPEYIIDRLRAEDGSPVVIEILFRALDKAEHVRNLLSLELTGCWFNECREIAKIIFDNMKNRVGRYPSEDNGGATWIGIICDTNPPDTDHWFYEYFEEEKPLKCKDCKMPNGDSVIYPSRDIRNDIIPFAHRKCPQCGKDYTNGIPLSKIWHQPSALAPNAENRKHLRDDYYTNLMAGATPEFVKVYVHGEYGYVGEGRPVYSNWSSVLHKVEGEIRVVKNYPLLVGMDYGLNPAAIVCQTLPNGMFNVLDEIVGKDMDFREFLTRLFKPYMAAHYFGMELVITGDPSGVARQGTDSNTCFKELKAHNLEGKPAVTNAIQARIAAVNTLLTKMLPIPSDYDSKIPFRPALQISGLKCPVLVKGFNGAYRRKRVPVIGKDIYRDEPEKTFESHIHDALQYAALLVDQGLLKVRRSMNRDRHRSVDKAPPVEAFT